MRWIAHGIAAMARPAETLQGWRNDMVEKFEAMGKRATVASIMQALGPIPEGVRAIQLLPPEKDAE